MSSTNHSLMDGSGRNKLMLDSREVMAEALHIARPVAHSKITFCSPKFVWTLHYFKPSSSLNGCVPAVILETMAYCFSNGCYQVW